MKLRNYSLQFIVDRKKDELGLPSIDFPRACNYIYEDPKIVIASQSIVVPTMPTLSTCEIFLISY